jgi:glycosyltransferase involved in cell wall biosynthesis
MPRMSGPRVTVLVHGGPASIEAVRARGLTRSAPEGAVEILFRDTDKAATGRRWKHAVTSAQPDLLYVLNTAAPGAVLAPWWRTVRGQRYVLDTGDAVYEMARTSGVGAGWKLPALWLFERWAHRRASAIVVRGTRHRELLLTQGRRRVEVIRDGFAEQQDVQAETIAALRTRLGLEGRFIFGVMGSTVRSEKLGLCYGWDLLEALVPLRDLPVTGLIIGDGSGLPWLKQRATELGVADRVVFTGRIPYPEVPAYLRLMDVALSTQTNNLPGQVRTTGKIPEYMAAGRFILASRVGEAELLLPPDMLVDYHGAVDPAYPARLAARVRTLCLEPARLAIAQSLPARAEELCAYPRLARQWWQLMRDVAQSGRS